MLLFFIVSALDVLMPMLNRILIDDYINKPGAPTSGFFAVIAAIAAVLFSGALFSSIRSVLMVKTGNKIVVRVREAVYAKVQQLSLAGITRSPEEYAALLSGCTREDIVRAAKRLTLDTIYFLKGKDAQ